MGSDLYLMERRIRKEIKENPDGKYRVERMLREVGEYVACIRPKELPPEIKTKEETKEFLRPRINEVRKVFEKNESFIKSGV